MACGSPTSIIGYICFSPPTFDRTCRITQRVRYETGIGTAIPRVRPTPRNQVPDVIRNPFIGSRRSAWSFPADDAVYDHTVVGPTKGLLSCSNLRTSVNCHIWGITCGAYLVHDYPECVNVTLLRRVAVNSPEA